MMLNIGSRFATRAITAVVLVACSLPKLIAPFPAGTATDTGARFLADKVAAT